MSAATKKETEEPSPCQRRVFLGSREDVHNDVLRVRAALEGNGSAGDARGHDEVRGAALFEPVEAVVGLHDEADVARGEHVAAVGMAGEYEVRACGCLGVIVVGLVVEHDRVFRSIRLCHQITCR